MIKPIKREYTEKMIVNAYYTWINEVKKIQEKRKAIGSRLIYWRIIAKELIKKYGSHKIDRHALTR